MDQHVQFWHIKLKGGVECTDQSKPGPVHSGVRQSLRRALGRVLLYQVKIWRMALSELSEHVAKAVAPGNAERLWKLQAGC